MKDYAQLLQKFRFVNKISQEELSKLLNVALMTIYRWESNSSKPSLEAKNKIDKLLKENKTKLDQKSDCLQAINNVLQKLNSIHEEVLLLKEWIDP